MGRHMCIFNEKHETPFPSVIATTAAWTVFFGSGIPSRVTHRMCEIFDVRRKEINDSDASAVLAIHKREYAGIVL
jgi:hypothetical protein